MIAKKSTIYFMTYLVGGFIIFYFLLSFIPIFLGDTNGEYQNNPIFLGVTLILSVATSWYYSKDKDTVKI